MKGANGNDGNMRKPFPWKDEAEQRADPDSLWNWQATLDRVRQDHPALRRGDLEFLTSNPDQATVYARTRGNDQVVVVLNLTDVPLDDLTIPLKGVPATGLTTLASTSGASELGTDGLKVRGLGPYGIQIVQVITKVD
jgi:glycosidase